jgi:hypothetical protein
MDRHSLKGIGATSDIQISVRLPAQSIQCKENSIYYDTIPGFHTLPVFS